LHLVGILFPHINDNARSKSLQTLEEFIFPIHDDDDDDNDETTAAAAATMTMTITA